MKKLSLAFSLLSTLAFAGTALADQDRGRAPIVDHRPVQAPIVVQHHSIIAAPIAVADAGLRMQAKRPGGMQDRWQLLSSQTAPRRRGTLTVTLPARGDLDQLKLIANQRGLDIVAVELTYARGRKEIVKPARDGSVSIDLAPGKLRSISVRYVNRGAGPGATIQVMGKDGDRGPARGR
jgi:hypothetical protein